jgi:signal transduction histidine kinase
VHDAGPRILACRRRPVLARLRPRDVVVAAVVLAIQLAVTAGAVGHHRAIGHPGCWWGACSATRLGPGAYLLLAIGPLALVVRRLLPRTVLAVAFLCAAVYAAVGYPAGPIFLSLIVAYANLVVAGDRRLAWATVAAAWVVFLWLPAAVGTGHLPDAADAGGLAAWLLVVVFAGEVYRTRHDRIAAQRRSVQEKSLRRAEEERLRIARELHDVLAHGISLINVQSGVALHLLDERPEQARTALEIIHEASADALGELRSVLGVLRRVDEEAPRRPAAGLERLGDLVASAAAAGVEVDTRTDGTARPLATPVDLAAYRIVQESLTNVARHAGGGRATVSLHYGPKALAIAVDDDGPATNGDAPGNGHHAGGAGAGIAGMRERAVALGGDLQAGPRPSGAGFRVRARLPYAGESHAGGPYAGGSAA